MSPWRQVELKRDQKVYCYNEADLRQATKGLAPGSYTLQRFKVRLRRLPS